MRKNSMIKKSQGTAHGKVVQFDDDLGFPEGERVQATIEVVEPHNAVWGEGLKRCAGALADSWTAEDDRVLEQIYRERKADPRLEP